MTSENKEIPERDKLSSLDKKLDLSTKSVALAAAVFGVITSISNVITGIATSQLTRSQDFSARITASVDILTGEDEKKAAAIFGSLYPLATDEQQKKVLIQLALINPKEKVLSTLLTLLEKDTNQLDREILKMPEIRQKILSIKSSLEKDEQVAQVQQALIDSGYYKGDANGYMDLATREAITRFQKDVGLSVKSQPGSKDLAAIIEYVKGGGFQPVHPSGQDPYPDNFIESSENKLLEIATISGTEGWIYLGQVEIFDQEIDTTQFSNQTISKLNRTILNKDVGLDTSGQVKLESPMYLREQPSGKIIGIAGKDSILRVQRVGFWGDSKFLRSVWAKVTLVSKAGDN